MSPYAVIKPTAEDAYWRRAFKDEPYYQGELDRSRLSWPQASVAERTERTEDVI